MDDDDAPPPLSSLADQIAAVELQVGATAAEHVESEAIDDSSLRVATTTYGGASTATATVVAVPTPAKLKKGFFNEKQAKKTATSTKQARTSAVSDDGIPVLTGKKSGIGSGSKAIPDFMRVEPDEQTKRMQEAKSKLIDALKPTKDTIDDLQTKPGLMSSFEDPEVMAAVDEIAKNPSAMAKYQNNQKVKDFYSAMAAFTGARLEKMGDQPI